ncbi:MAG: hypothetical protein B5766_12620, partial [Candidatus Lumbricidophila eiseniae]
MSARLRRSRFVSPFVWYRFSWFRTPLTIVVLLVFGVGVSFLRVPSALYDYVWAEDLGLFLREATIYGPWNVLVEGYAGYQHLVPRIMTALIVNVFPLRWYAVAVFVACAVVVGLVVVAVYWLARDLVPWTPARLVLALIPAILPLSAEEVLGNMANLHTYMVWLVLWLVLARHRSWAGASFWAVIAFLAIMTEIQAIPLLLLLPVVLWRPDPRSWPTAIVLAIGAAWQIITALTVERTIDEPYTYTLPALGKGWLINVVAPLVFSKPDNLRAQLVERGFLVPVLILLPFLVAFVLILIRGSGYDRLLGITVAVISGGLYAGCVVLNNFGAVEFERFSHSDWAATTAIFNVRYGVAAQFFLAALIPIAANLLRQGSRAGPGAQQHPVKVPHVSQSESSPPLLPIPLLGRVRALMTRVVSWAMLIVLAGTLLTAGQFGEKPRRAN